MARGVVKHVTDKSVPNAVQVSSPTKRRSYLNRQQQSQTAALAEDLTELSKLWPLRDNIAKDSTKIMCIPPYHRPRMYTTSKAET